MADTSLMELAVPLASNALTFFVGSGFSKYLTDGAAPNWLELLEALTERIDSNRTLGLRAKLFNTNSEDKVVSGKMELSITAQMLEFEYERKGYKIRDTIQLILEETVTLETINSKKLSKLQKFFQKHENINLVTTNYDTLLSTYVLQGKAKTIIDGSVIPKVNNGYNVFHIHGCVTKPESLVFTISDYFEFQHKDNYLSRKLFTLLQDTTVAVIGYSVNDFNLNNIFNEAQHSKAVSLRNSDIFLISKEPVDPLFTNYYRYTYGMKVLSPHSFDDFFVTLESSYAQAKPLVEQIEKLEDVLNGKLVFTDTYLKLSSSFRDILLQASHLGITLNDPRMVKLIIALIKKKHAFTREDGAWEQYEQLADWLIELAEHTRISGTPIEADYLEEVQYSMRMMRKQQTLGYSWAAYTLWLSRFSEVLLENQQLIRKFVQDNFQKSDDAYSVIAGRNP